jgi:hypothetical protein
VRDDGRRARIMAAVIGRDAAAGAGELVKRLCRFAVDEMALSGCALVLMSGRESAGMLAGAGRHASTVSGLQMELGEGPCLQAYASGVPVLLPDLAAEGASRWPAFAAAALAVGVHAEFSLPLTTGPGGIGTLDLCRDRPGMKREAPQVSRPRPGRAQAAGPGERACLADAASVSATSSDSGALARESRRLTSLPTDRARRRAASSQGCRGCGFSSITHMLSRTSPRTSVLITKVIECRRRGGGIP